MFDEVIEQWHINLAPDAFNLFLRPEGFDKQHIRTSLSVCRSAVAYRRDQSRPGHPYAQ